MDTKHLNNIQDPVARAEALRAQAIADMLLDGMSAVRGWFKPLTAKIAAYLEYRRTYDVLSSMTNRELDDIGIGRGDIRAVARGFDPRPSRVAMPGSALAQHLALAEAFEQETASKPAAQETESIRPAAAA